MLPFPAVLHFPVVERSWPFRAGACLVAGGLICTLLVVSPLHGQRATRPRVSPHETTTSAVDGAKISITSSSEARKSSTWAMMKR